MRLFLRNCAVNQSVIKTSKVLRLNPCASRCALAAVSNDVGEPPLASNPPTANISRCPGGGFFRGMHERCLREQLREEKEFGGNRPRRAGVRELPYAAETRSYTLTRPG